MAIQKYEPERGSATLNWLADYIETELTTMRRKNDGDLDPIATAKLRGHIQALTVLKNRIEPFIPPQERR